MPEDKDYVLKPLFDGIQASVTYTDLLSQIPQPALSKAEAPSPAPNELGKLTEGERRFLSNRAHEVLVYYPRNSPGDGYNDATLAVGPLSFYNVQDLLARFFITVSANYGTVGNWRPLVVGCTSTIYPTYEHMPMFDYDGRNVKKVIRKDVRRLQEEFGLGDAWIYETKRGFHVYFFCDAVPTETYCNMLQKVDCCRGFKKATLDRQHAVLRISAKYTEFDIKPLYVLASKSRKPKRMLRKAHVIRALIDLGQECGTHLASLYPQWAHFQEDPKEWKPPTKQPRAKRIKKSGHKNLQLQKKVSKYELAYGGGSSTYTTSAPKSVFASVDYPASIDYPAWNWGNNTNSGTSNTS